MLRSLQRCAKVVSLAAAGLVSSCAGEAPCNGDYGSSPDGPTDAQAVHVATCGSDANDGSRSRPFRTVARALASTASTVLVAGGSYGEDLPVIARAVAVVGLSAASTTIVGAGEATGANKGRAVIHVADAGTVTLQNLTVRGNAQSGIFAERSILQLNQVSVTGMKGIAPAPLGHGVSVVDGTLVGAHISLNHNQGCGLLARRSRVSVTGLTVDENRGGGVALIDRPSGGTASSFSDLRAAANDGFGFASWGASADVAYGSIVGTRSTAPGRDGDGVVVLGLAEAGRPEAASRVDLGAVSISENARIGVLVDGSSSGSLSGALIGENGRGGLWLQRGAVAGSAFAVTGSTFRANQFGGVVVTSGASLAMKNSTVLGTRSGTLVEGLATVSVGDGLSVFDSASALVTQCVFGVSARVAIVVDGAAPSTSFSQNQIAMTGDAVVLQGAAPGTVVFSTTDNSLASGARVVDVGLVRSLETVRASISVAASAP